MVEVCGFLGGSLAFKPDALAWPPSGCAVVGFQRSGAFLRHRTPKAFCSRTEVCVAKIRSVETELLKPKIPFVEKYIYTDNRYWGREVGRADAASPAEEFVADAARDHLAVKYQTLMCSEEKIENEMQSLSALLTALKRGHVAAVMTAFWHLERLRCGFGGLSEQLKLFRLSLSDPRTSPSLSFMKDLSQQYARFKKILQCDLQSAFRECAESGEMGPGTLLGQVSHDVFLKRSKASEEAVRSLLTSCISEYTSALTAKCDGLMAQVPEWKPIVLDVFDAPAIKTAILCKEWDELVKDWASTNIFLSALKVTK